MNVSKGDVYLVDLGKDKHGSIQNGIRPCVIMGNEYSCKHGTISLVIPCTSKKKNTLPTHYSLSIDKYPFLWAKSSTCLCEQCMPIDREQQIVAYMGRIDKEDINELNERIKIAWGLE